MISGIYIIKNIKNNKVYIGQSKNIEKRFKQYRNSLKNKYCHNYKLQKDYDKYGLGYFEFDILQKDVDPYELDEFESKYIKKFNSVRDGYNLSKPLDYEILDNEELVLDIKNKLLKAMTLVKHNTVYLLNDVASKLNISENDICVIMRKGITWSEYVVYDTELRIENDYTKKIIRKICISEQQKTAKESMKGFCL
jgi:hypothetical protein